MAPQTRTKSRGKEKKEDKTSSNSQECPTGGCPFSVASVKKYWEKYVNLDFGKKLLFNPEYTWVMAAFLIFAEVFINSFIVIARPYTEIDWKAYMQEVEGFLNGTLDYAYLKGDTGPLVYPAGFVYIYSLLYFATDHGTNIRLGQWIFVGFYLVMMYQVFKIYTITKKVPPYALMFLTFTSYRIHSIFVLRLFNDPVAIILAYFAINNFLRGRWTLGSLAFSLAVSVKMNILLYAPALLIVYLTQLSLFDTIVQLAVCGSLQVVLALPFLLVNPWSYISRSFDLGRVFFYEWTVNWKFLPEEIFLNRFLHIGLLSAHILALLIFVPIWLRFLQSYHSFEKVANTPEGKVPMQVRSQLVVLPLFVSNFIGICFSRSLHYQFYVWYYHTIPYLLWTTRLPVRVKLILFGVIEMCWNVFPATAWSSLSLVISHFIILISIWEYCKPKKDWSKLEWGDSKKTK